MMHNGMHEKGTGGIAAHAEGDKNYLSMDCIHDPILAQSLD